MTCHALLQRLHDLAAAGEWDSILSVKEEALAVDSTPVDRAWAVYIIGRAYWNLGRDAFDYAEGVRLAREASRLDPLEGRAAKGLGIRLVTIGKFHEGSLVLQEWMGRYRQWSPEVQSTLADVQYALGYAARYEGNLRKAAMWYKSAYGSFSKVGNVARAETTACALAQVSARLGDIDYARSTLALVPEGGPNESYRLKALTEVLAAEGATEEALTVGRKAALAFDDDDPWELAELHLLLAKLQFQSGNHEDKYLHLDWAMEAMRCSPRHDLYTAARLLLDHERLEVIA